MRIIRYDKLVRDRIPEIIRASGKSCTTEVLSDEAYLRMIDAKLDEELAEYHQEQNLEELADLLEVCAQPSSPEGIPWMNLSPCAHRRQRSAAALRRKFF